MKVRVLFFGPTHDVTGFAEDSLLLPEGAVLDDAWREYEGRFPRLKSLGASLLWALNQQIVSRTAPLRDGDEIAFLPPVSGGGPHTADANAHGDFYRLTREVVCTGELVREMKAPVDGAVVVFEGIVRDNLHGRPTRYLEYEGYEPMAVRTMEEIGAEARQKFAIDRVAIIHRLGRLEIGETSVAIVVTSAHRRAAFQACQFAIDRLKQIVPIWKKEYFEDGAVWAESESRARVPVEASS
jgi:molybdopterin synthase catalytic subunit